MEVLALVLARGGSKGIPRKNLRKLGGKPLIKYSIDAAKKSKLVSRIIVSTDDEEIAKTSQKNGAEIPFIRPKKISGDNASQLDVVKHAISFLEINEKYMPDIITILHPTNPFRNGNLIDKSIRLLKKSNVDLVLGVSEVLTHPYRSFWHKGKYLKQFSNDFHKYFQRQLFPKLYFPTGDIYTLKYSSLKKHGVIFGPKIFPLIQKNNQNSINIDTDYEMFVAEMTIKYWKTYHKKFNHESKKLLNQRKSK